MRGMVFRGDRKIEIASFDDPVPGPGEVVVEIKASGMCGSDLKFYRGAMNAALAAFGTGPADLGDDLRIIAGHEPCGVVAATGPGVDERSVRVGDRVMVYHYTGCGMCRECRAGWTQMCERGTDLIGSTVDGGHADYLKVPATTLLPLPDELSFSAGAAICCGTGTAYGGLIRLDLSARDTIAIFGLGPVGQSAVQLAAAMGAQVIAVDISSERVARAEAFGAAHAINSSMNDPVEAIREMTGGRGTTCTLDCSGASTARQAAVRSLAPRGKGRFRRPRRRRDAPRCEPRRHPEAVDHHRFLHLLRCRPDGLCPLRRRSRRRRGPRLHRPLDDRPSRPGLPRVR